MIEIPDKREAALSIYGNNRVFFGTSSLRDAAPMRLSSALAELSLVTMHRPGDRHFAILDLEKMTYVRVETTACEIHDVRSVCHRNSGKTILLVLRFHYAPSLTVL